MSVAFDALFDRIVLRHGPYPGPWGSCPHRQDGFCPDCTAAFRREYRAWQSRRDG